MERMLAKSVDIVEFLDGTDEGVVLLGRLCGNAETMIVEAVEVGGITDQNAVVFDEPVLQFETGGPFNVDQHIMGLRVHHHQSFYLR